MWGRDVGAGQDSPFWTRETGGCMKSLKGPRASLRAELTSYEEHVMHSTRVGYRAITWAHVLASTAAGTQAQGSRGRDGGGRTEGREEQERSVENRKEVERHLGRKAIN